MLGVFIGSRLVIVASFLAGIARKYVLFLKYKYTISSKSDFGLQSFKVPSYIYFTYLKLLFSTALG